MVWGKPLLLAATAIQKGTIQILTLQLCVSTIFIFFHRFLDSEYLQKQLNYFFQKSLVMDSLGRISHFATLQEQRAIKQLHSYQPPIASSSSGAASEDTKTHSVHFHSASFTETAIYTAL